MTGNDALAVPSVPLLTVRQCAERLQVNERTVRRLIERGDLPAVRVGRGVRPPLRIDPGELDEFVYGLPVAGA